MWYNKRHKACFMLEVKNKIKIGRGNIFFALVAFLVVFLGLENGVATAVEDCSAKPTSEEQESCKKDLLDKADDIRQLIDLKNKQQKVIQNQLQLINLEQQKNSAEFKNEQEKLAELTQQIFDMENKIREKEKLVDQQKNILASLMRSYYESFSEGIQGVILIGNDIPKIFSQSDYLEQSSAKINEVLQIIRDAKKDLENDRSEMTEKKEESEKVKATLQKRGLTLQSNEDLKETQAAKTEKEKSNYEKLLSDIEDEVAQLEAGKGEANLSSLPPLKKGYFTYPVNPIIVSQSYGKTSFSSHYAGGLHNGIDFSIKYDKVYAAKAGTVLATGNNGRYAYGKWVAVDHGDGLVTLYGHFSQQQVSRGATVKEGQTLGISGNTGYSTGPHLHFSVFSKSSFEIVESKKVEGLMLPVGASVNPMRYL